MMILEPEFVTFSNLNLLIRYGKISKVWKRKIILIIIKSGLRHGTNHLNVLVHIT